MTTAGILAVSTAAYVVYVRSSPFGPTGGSLPGLIFGIIAALLMLYAFLLAVRRRLPAARLGSGQFWLRGHLWMGALTVPMVLFHAGFGFGGLLEQVLMALFAVVVFSGMYGLIVQHVIPRVMQQVVPHETFLEQIPFLRRCNLIMCDQVVAKQCGSLDIADDPLAPTLTGLINESAKLGREEKDKWLDSIDPSWHAMFRSLARRAKEATWSVIKDDGKTASMRQESDFPMALRFMYELKGVSVPAPAPAEAKGPAASGPDRAAALSPLQAARKVPAAPNTEAAPAPASPAAPPADKPATPSAGGPAAGAKLSPVQLARMQAQARQSAKPTSPAAEPNTSGAAPQAESVAAPAAASPPPAAEPAKPAEKLSPLQLARMQAAAKKGETPPAPSVPAVLPEPAPSDPAPAAGTQPTAQQPSAPEKLSPLQLARMQAAAKQGTPPTAPPVSTDNPPGAADDVELEASWSPETADSLDFSSESFSLGGSISGTGEGVVEGKVNPDELAKIRAALKHEIVPPSTSPPPAKAEQPGTPPATAAPESKPPAEPPKKLSPLEMARMQAAAKAKSAPVPAGTAPAVEAKQADAAPAQVPPASTEAPAAGAASEPAQPASPAKKLSPLEIARMQAAAKAKAGAPEAAPAATPPAPGAAPTKLSPLEMARKQAAAKAAASTPAGAAAAPADASTPPGVPVPATVAPVRAPEPSAAAKPAPPVRKPAAPAELPETVPPASLDRLKKFYLHEGVRNYLRDDAPFAEAFSVPENALRTFARLRGELPVALHGAIDAIEKYCDEQRQLIQLKRLHRQLHWWLAVHVPASVAVMVLMIVHIVLALRVVPFSF
jgi:hypothetical protein